MLNSRLDIGSPCLDPFWMSKMFALFVCLYRSLLVSVNFPQEADVLVIDVARFECLPNRFVRDGVERLREVDRRCPHFDSPLMAFLFNQSACCKVVRCLVSFSESSLIFCLFLVKHWVSSSIQNCREQFVQRR